ncbi:Pol polyprotein, partial [Mucuna pruriens]
MHIVTDNGTNLNNKTMTKLCKQFKIHHHNSTPYRPRMNGVVEAANKNIKKIPHLSTNVHKGNPLFIIVLPIEVEIPSLRVLAEVKLEKAEWIQNRFDQLNLIEEKQFTALCHEQLY